MASDHGGSGNWESYEAELERMFAGMSDAEIQVEWDQHVDWRHWEDADYCYDELQRRKHARKETNDGTTDS